jgi:hypothetical protein
MKMEIVCHTHLMSVDSSMMPILGCLIPASSDKSIAVM